MWDALVLGGACLPGIAWGQRLLWLRHAAAVPSCGRLVVGPLCTHAHGWEVISISTSIHVVLRTLHRLPPPATHTPQGFTATFRKTTFASGEWQEELHAPEPPFTILSVADLVPQDQRVAYAAAGGELL